MGSENPPRAYHHGALRDALLFAAARQVAISGHEKLSLRKCAREAGVDPSAVYRHFKSRDDLLAALALDYFANLADTLTATLREYEGTDGGKPMQALIAMAHGYVDFAVRNRREFDAMFAHHSIRKNFKTDAKGEAGLSPIAVLEDALRFMKPHASSQGISIAELARIFWVSIHGQAVLTANKFAADDSVRNKEATQRIIHTIARGIGWNEAPETMPKESAQ